LCVFKRFPFQNIVADDDGITVLQSKTPHLVKVMLTWQIINGNVAFLSSANCFTCNKKEVPLVTYYN
jgi:hypothetical protein